MYRQCNQCGQQFEITPSDLAFYEKVSPVFQRKKELIPPPTLCPECRMQRRFAWRNESKLYRRTCDATGKPIISIFRPDIPHKIYSYEAWWSDTWDPLSYGKPFDFNRPFFDLFGELLKVVPLSGSGYKSKCENCDYCNQQNDSKNCYLTFGSGFMEDCAYASWTYYAKDTFDTLGCMNIELSAHLVDCTRMYGCTECQDCTHCTNCRNCRECAACEDCTGCVGLHRQKYCLFNEQLTEEEYRRRVVSLSPEDMRTMYRKTWLASPHRAVFHLHCEACGGDHLTNCKKVEDSYHVWDAQDCRFQQDIIEQKDSYDCTRSGISELCYENVSGGRYYHGLFVSSADTTVESCYAHGCFYGKHLFGCVSAHRKEYCILNKQYSKEEYEALVPKIITHMRATGEWGEFFPVSLSPYPYNDTLAQEYFPLTKDEAEQRGWGWMETEEEPMKVAKIIPAAKLPAGVDDIPDDILNWAIECEATKRPFKIIKQELEFYRKMRLPVPRFHPDERHRRRMALRNPRKLWKRQCQKCGKDIQTTYAPDRPEIVYCDRCYLQEVY